MSEKQQLGVPPPAVIAFLRKLGFHEVDLGVPGAQPWWRSSSSAPLPWGEVLDVTADEVLSLRASMAKFPASVQKPFWKTSEFWMAVAGTGAAAGAGLTQLGTDAESLPPPWNTIVGVFCTVMGLALPVGYSFARNVAKEKAQEEVRLLPEPSKTDPDNFTSEKKD